MDTFDIEFHFPYDKVKVENVSKATVDTYAASVRRLGLPFEVAILDYRGNATDNVELINPAMVTHTRITKHLPF